MNLEEKIISEITGKFTIEAYQRGYRWGKDEVEYLLEDINEIPDGQKYCLQPVVVKNVNDTYELIDGQQRLTDRLQELVGVCVDTEIVPQKTMNKLYRRVKAS